MRKINEDADDLFRLKALMLKRGITAFQLAEMIAVSYPTMLRVFNGTRQLTSHEMKRIAAALGFSIEDIPYFMLGGKKTYAVPEKGV